MPREIGSSHLPSFPLALAGMILSSLACTGIPFLAPTATATPSNIPTPTATASARPTRTKTPTVTPTHTPSLAPTTSYLDWPVVFSDPFDDPYGGWYTGKSDEELITADISITGGKYLFKLTTKTSVSWRFTPDINTLDDFYLSVDMKKTKGTKESNHGLVFRDNDIDFYYFCVDATAKQYGVALRSGDAWQKIIPLTGFEGIDPIGVNQLAVLSQGSRYGLFINGKEVDSLADDTLNKGRVGIGFELQAGDFFELEFDNFIVRAPGD